MTVLAVLALAPTWSDVWHKIESCHSVKELSGLQRRLGQQKDRCSQVGSAVCLYYLDSADHPSGNGSSVIFSALKMKGQLTAEELVWRYKLSRVFTEPDVPEVDFNSHSGTVVINGRTTPVYTMASNKAMEQRSDDIRSALHLAFPGTPEDRYIQALASREPITSIPQLKKVGSVDRLWKYDVQWSIESRSSMVNREERAGRSRLNKDSVIYKIRFRTEGGG